MKKPRYTPADYAAILDNANDFHLGRISVTQFLLRSRLFWEAIPRETAEDVQRLVWPETLAVANGK